MTLDTPVGHVSQESEWARQAVKRQILILSGVTKAVFMFAAPVL